MDARSRRGRGLALVAALGVVAAIAVGGCYSVRDSQRYFREAAAEDPSLELLYETTIYTVYFDHALRRCILHSAHTWGEKGGGGGGTGVGVTAFRCDPSRIRGRLEQLETRGPALRYERTPRRAPSPSPAEKASGHEAASAKEDAASAKEDAASGKEDAPALPASPREDGDR